MLTHCPICGEKTIFEILVAPIIFIRRYKIKKDGTPYKRGESFYDHTGCPDLNEKVLCTNCGWSKQE